MPSCTRTTAHNSKSSHSQCGCTHYLALITSCLGCQNSPSPASPFQPIFFSFLLFYLILFFKRGEEEREKLPLHPIHALTHLVVPCMGPDQTLNPQPWPTGKTLQPSYPARVILTSFLHYCQNSSTHIFSMKSIVTNGKI